MLGKVNTFLKESYREFRRVNWPTQKETVRFTVVVIVISLAVAAYLGLLDYIFVGILERLVL